MWFDSNETAVNQTPKPDSCGWRSTTPTGSVRSAPGWLAEHILADREEIEGPTRLNVLVGRAPELTVPGVLLLGDAACPMSPVHAQEIDLALRDSVVAANHLVPILMDGADP